MRWRRWGWLLCIALRSGVGEIGGCGCGGRLIAESGFCFHPGGFFGALWWCGGDWWCLLRLCRRLRWRRRGCLLGSALRIRGCGLGGELPCGGSSGCCLLALSRGGQSSENERGGFSALAGICLCERPIGDLDRLLRL